MSKELEARLRRRAWMHGDYEGALVNPDGPESADQLERYRVALEKIVAADFQILAVEELDAMDAVRQALEPKP